MKYLAILIIPILALPLFVFPGAAQAGDCFRDPIYDHEWTGTVTTGAFVRDVACMEGSVVMTTLPVNTNINITGETDGWWRVQLSTGETGWVGQWLISVTDTSGFVTTPTQTTNPEPTISTTTSTSASLVERTKGYILLQVEEHGEAWYVNPADEKRYYMKDGPTAYEMMRKFGLGISNADLARLQAGDWELKNRLKGKILLQVEEHGEAYYIHPDAGDAHYMKDGDAAYSLMRFYSLGISNLDLDRIPLNEFTALASN